MLPRSGCTDVAPRHARHPKPAPSDADGMGTGIGGRHRGKDGRVHRVLTMATDIRAPEEQEGTKAVLKTWLKKVGDPVRRNDPIVELETDKVAVEVAAE